MSESIGEYVDIDDLKPWADNPRDNEEAVAEVARSIERFGFASPILAREEDSEIIAGHTRYKAARKLGLRKVPVRYINLNPVDSHLLALADNKIAERANWDQQALGDIMKSLDGIDADISGLGWSEDELKELIAPEQVDLDGSEADMPEIDEGAEVQSEPGEIYELGPHRLLCGDSTKGEAWAGLMGNEKLQMVWTDPPYGVAVNAVKDVEEARKLHRRTDGLVIENDQLSPEELLEFLREAFDSMMAVCAPGASWYVAAPSGNLFHPFASALLERFIWRHTLVWVKDRLVMGRCDYHYRHESIFYGWVKGTHYFCEKRNLDTVLECPRPHSSKIHPTMKPVELIKRMVENSSRPGWIVGDGFGGSGSTLLACALTGRIARLIELDPRYCDAIRRRWTTWAVGHNLDPGKGALLE